MQTIFALLCVAVVAVSAQSRVSVKVGLQRSKEVDLVYHTKKNIGAVFQLQCFTGPDENGFEISVRQDDSYSRNTNGYVEIPSIGGRKTMDEGDKPVVVIGKLSELVKEDTDEICEENYGELPKACSKKFSGKAKIKQYITVPGSQSPLAWVGQYEVDFSCLWSPVDDNTELIEPDVNNVILSDCDTFGYEIVIGSVEGPVCEIKVRTAPTITQKGMGYTLQNCYVTSDVNPTHRVQLVENGQAVQNGAMRVEARQVGSTIGRAYDLTVHNLPVNSGRVDCDIIHCRFTGNLPTANLPECPEFEGALPVQAAAARSFAPSRTLSGLLNLRQGAVTLHVPNATGQGMHACNQ